MAGRGGVEHVGFEHGVESQAAQLDAVVHQHVHVVLAVLADLRPGLVLEQRFERGEYGIAVKLLRHAHVAVAQRHVGGLAWLDGKGDADQFGALGVEAGGLGVEGEALGRLQPLEPALEIGLLENRLVFGLGLHRAAVGLHRAIFAGGLGLAQQFVEPLLELELAVERNQRLAMRRLGHQVGDLHLQRHVELDGRQLIGKEGRVTVLLELGRQRLGAADRQAGDLVEVLVQALEAAVDAIEQATGGLLANTRDPGNVVDLVAHQREEIDDQLRAYAEFGLHALDVVDAAAHGVDQRDMRADQLRHVLVAGGDHHVAAERRALPGQGADHVVGLHALDVQQRQAEGAHRGVQRFDLHA